MTVAWPWMLLVLTLGTACDPLTRNRFDMIAVNESTPSDVRHTLGEPTTRMNDVWLYERTDRHLNVVIDFNDGVVARKQWIDAAHSTWLDSQPLGDTNVRDKTEIRTRR